MYSGCSDCALAEARIRSDQAARAARLLGVDRLVLDGRDRLLIDCVATRMSVARLIRLHRPRIVFGTDGDGVHPDHRALTDIVVHGVFYARLPKWEQIEGAAALHGTQPHEIDRLFLARCRMERAWKDFEFAVDVTGVYARKLAAIRVYDSVFQCEQTGLIDRYQAEDLGGVVTNEQVEALPLEGRNPTITLRLGSLEERWVPLLCAVVGAVPSEPPPKSILPSYD